MTDLPPNYHRIFEHGFVAIKDVMGSDAAIVEAARCSYTNETKVTRTDRQLIRYLFRNFHLTPFEMCEVKFHIRAPIFVVRQIARHRTANTNEESGRYSVLRDDFYVPELGAIKPQSQNNKQGRDGEFSREEQNWLQQVIKTSGQESFEDYRNLLQDGVARELARVVTPVSTFTSFYWKMDLRNLLHFLALRTDSHAQYEIREYANLMVHLVQPLFPDTFEAWEDYQRQAKTFSRMEMGILKMILRRHDAQNYLNGLIEDQNGEKNFAEKHGMSAREMTDFLEKITNHPSS